MDRVYRSWDHDWLLVLGGLVNMEWRGHQGMRIRCDSSERERGGRQGSHQWHHFEAELHSWPHDGVQ
jgi:hypothetical protein